MTCKCRLRLHSYIQFFLLTFSVWDLREIYRRVPVSIMNCELTTDAQTVFRLNKVQFEFGSIKRQAASLTLHHLRGHRSVVFTNACSFIVYQHPLLHICRSP